MRPMSRVSIGCVVLSLAAAASACSKDSAEPEPCPTGWWSQSAAGSCSACTAGAKNPECGRSDCQQLSLQGFDGKAREFNVIVTYSRESGTISSVGDVVARAYRVEGGKISIEGMQPGTESACSGSGELRIDYARLSRIDPAIRFTLDAQVASSVASFQGVPIGR
jgi:hypothetical protein